MFPNVRLLIGALFASVVTLSCGFGLFAAFRVNHEPLSRLPVGTATVQLVANEVAAPRAGWGTPFDGQSRANGLQPNAPAAEIPAAMPVNQSSASSPATVGAIKPAAANATRQDTAAPAAAAPSTIAAAPPSSGSATVTPSPVATTTAPPVTEVAAHTPATASANAPQQSKPAASKFTPVSASANNTATPASVAPDQTASVPSPAVQAPSPAEQSASASSPATSAASAASPPTTQNSVAKTEAPTPAPAANQDTGAGEAARAASPVIATITPPDQSSDHSSAVMSSPEQTEAVPSSAVAPEDTAALPVGKFDAKMGIKAIGKPVARHRVAIRKRVRKRARATVQNSGFNDPVFRTAPNFSGTTASRGTAKPFGWANNQ